MTQGSVWAASVTGSGSTMALLEIDGYTLNRYRLQPLVLEPSQILELLLPDGWRDEDDARLRELFEQAARSGGTTISFAGALEHRRLTWIDRIRRISVLQALAAVVPGSPEVARRLCDRCGVDPEQQLATMPWTERKLVDSEIAALEGRVIVVTDIGLDPLGQQRFATHLKGMANRLQVGVLAIRGPIGFSAGAWCDQHTRIVPIA
jgi:hypothetical protein